MSRPGPAVDFVDLMLRAHRALDDAEMLHAFGGALALAWCIPEPRATNDIDLNIFVPAADHKRVLSALPADIEVSERSRMLLERDGQARLWWSRIPLDVFLANDPFHIAVVSRIVVHDFAGTTLPFLACRDLAVFKAFFNRDKDWLDIGEMVKFDSIDVFELIEQLIELLGPGDHRIARLRALRDDVEDGRAESG